MASELFPQVSFGRLCPKAELSEPPAKSRVLSPALCFVWPSLPHQVDFAARLIRGFLSTTVTGLVQFFRTKEQRS